MEERSPETMHERRVFELLEQIIDLDREEQEAFLEDTEPTLAEELRAILAEHNEVPRLESPPTAFFADLEREGEGAPLPDIGPYRLVKLLGEGGMGRVYLAEQKEGVERRVALKLLRFTVAGREARARFAAERHAMGRLDHPNIGRILEAGTTAEGQPFFAMELIEGSPITHYCREKRLPLKDRLRLFLQVCRGAHHAHLKLLLHRDLKPSNILVAEIDGRPVPKIIDFGVAKGLDGALLGESLATGDRLIGTPAYMSPEALEGDELDVRSDIFSLGVLLHELLTGVRPWEARDRTPVGLLKKRLEEQEIPRPSTRVTREGGRSKMLEDPAELAQRLRGDLDWIVLRALARDPAERYGSAAELADDVERTLRDEPISARPPTATYLLRKLVRRHRTAFFAALVTLVAVLLGAFGTSLGLLRARQAEAVAQEEARRAVRARDAEREISEFLLRIFRATGFESGADPRPPTERTARELLDHAAERLATELGDHPLTKARLEGTIGIVYRELGLYETSHQHLLRALELFEEDPDTTPQEIARIHLQLATTNFEFNDTDATLRHVDRGLEALGEPSDREGRLLVAKLLGQRGHVERRRNDPQASERALERALEILRSIPDPPPMALSQAFNDLAFTYFSRERWADAEVLFRQSLEIQHRETAPGHPLRAKAADNLGAAIASQGRLEEAIPLFEQALEERRRMLGDDHPDLAISLNNLGMVNLESGRPERAEQYHREALELRRRAFGSEHPTTAWSLDNLARTLEELGRIEEARELQAEALAVREVALGPGHPTVPRSRSHLARLALAAGESTLARELFERTLEERTQALGPEHPQVGLDTVHLARALWRLGERDTARQTAARGLAQIEAAGEDGAKDLRRAHEILESEGMPTG